MFGSNLYFTYIHSHSLLVGPTSIRHTEVMYINTNLIFSGDVTTWSSPLYWSGVTHNLTLNRTWSARCNQLPLGFYCDGHFSYKIQNQVSTKTIQVNFSDLSFHFKVAGIQMVVMLISGLKTLYADFCSIRDSIIFVTQTDEFHIIRQLGFDQLWEAVNCGNVILYVE